MNTTTRNTTAGPSRLDSSQQDSEPTWQPALLAEAGDDGRIRCVLCPHLCALSDGQYGYCHVRRNHGGQLQTATYTAAVQHIDAIERKPFYHVRPGSTVLTIGAPGCSFRCDYCVNHRLSQYGREQGVQWAGPPADPDALVRRALREQAAIGLSYTEPGLSLELTLDLAERAAPVGVPIVWKSNGFLTPAALGLAAPALSAVNIDVKADTDQAHRRLTGAPLGPVLDAVQWLRNAGVWVEISTPLIPGASAEPERLRRIAGWIAHTDPTIPWHLLRFTPDFRMAGHRPTSPAELAAAVAIGREAGLSFVYVERALGAAGRATLCPGCGSTLVERGVWQTLTNRVLDGRCPDCTAPVSGLWSGDS